MKIAVIGSGISGLTCAHYLDKLHEVTLFEANDYFGGHTATKNVVCEGKTHAIDTGFIVFNDRNYRHFRQLMRELGIGEQKTEMSFSVKNPETGLEYNGNHLWSLFAQKRNLINPKFYAFLLEILRFNKAARHAYAISLNGHPMVEQTLGDFLSNHQFSHYFCQNYILPMGAAIWSSTLSDMREFPFKFFLKFFYNHGLLDIQNRPQWFVIPGGSREYVSKILSSFRGTTHLKTPVQQIIRNDDQVLLKYGDCQEVFDHVILACHSDQAFKLLQSPTCHETTVLNKMQYQTNEAVLHTDTSLLPKRQRAWASWNYFLGDLEQREQRLANLTYNMNILQNIQAPETFCVSLNSSHLIDPNKIIERMHYEHPVFNQHMIDAQTQRHLINGVNRTWYCGAYWYNGFHEDGVKSALDVVQQLNQRAMTDQVAIKEQTL